MKRGAQAAIGWNSVDDHPVVSIVQEVIVANQPALSKYPVQPFDLHVSDNGLNSSLARASEQSFSIESLLPGRSAFEARPRNNGIYSANERHRWYRPVWHGADRQEPG